MKITEYNPYEEVEQQIFVKWLEENGYIFTAIPNSTYTKSWKQKRKNYSMGLRSGLPDLIVIIPSRGLVFVEMKRRKGGTIKSNQKKWIEELNKLKGVEAVVAKGADEAIKYIEKLKN